MAEIMKNEAFKSIRSDSKNPFDSRPKSKMGNRSYDTPEIDTDLELAYKQLITKLLEIPYPSNSVLPDIHLSPSAKDKVKHFHDWLEPKLVDGLEHMDGWGAKLHGNMLRLAGILHCAKNPKEPDQIALSEETAQQAITISKYFLRHAKCVYNLLGTDKDIQQAKHIIKKLQQQDKPELTKYQIYRMCRGSFHKVEDIAPILDILVDYGYLKEKRYSAPTGGRPRAKRLIYSNPLFFDRISER